MDGRLRHAVSRRAVRACWLLAFSLGASLAGCADRLDQGSPARLTLSPASYAFGTVIVGRRESVTVRVVNVGGSPLVVSSIAPREGGSPAYRVTSTRPLPWTIGPTASESFEVSFEPTTTGRHAADLEVRSSDSSQPLAVFRVEALDNVPRFSVSPTVVDFGAVEPGATATLEVAMTNDGSAGLEVLRARLEGDPELSVLPQAYPVALLPTEVAALRLSYSPARCGADASTIELVTTDPNTRDNVLTVVGHTPGRSFVMSPARARFNPLAQGGSSTRPVTLRSRGTEPLTVRGVTLVDEPGQQGGAAEFAIVSAPSNIVLQPNESVELMLAFSPVRVGERRALLRIESDDCAGSPRDVPVSGLSLTTDATSSCQLASEPTSLDFGGVSTLGGLRDLVVSVRVVGNGPCTFNGTFVSTPGESFFEVVAQPPLGSRLQSGDVAPIAVRFRPTRPGGRTGRVFVNALDPSRADAFVETSFAVSGTAGPAVLFIDPRQHDFGAVRVGCASKEATFTFSSVGESEVVASASVEASAQTVLTTPPPPSLPARTSALVRARMLPTSAGALSGRVLVTSNDEESPVQAIDVKGRAVEGSQLVDKFVQPSRPAADLLFVVDNSGSMADEQATLERSFGTFAAEAVRQGGDYRIGVITTDTPFLRGAPAVVRATDANPEASFRRNVRVGLGGSGIERGFMMALSALTPPLSTTSNAGFLRVGVPLELVFVSDEDDQSPSSVDQYLRSFALVQSRFRVSAIVGPALGCASATGRASPGARYLDAAARTGGITGNICDANFGAALTRLGEAAFSARDTFHLTGEPDVSQPIRAFAYPNEAACDADQEAIAGTPIAPDALTYDANANAIVLARSVVPPRGACVLVRYTLTCRRP